MSVRAMGLGQLTVPVGAEDEHPHALLRGDEVAEQQQAPLVRPLQVIEDQDHRLVPRTRPPATPRPTAKSRNRSVSASSALRRREVGDAAGQGRHQIEPARSRGLRRGRGAVPRVRGSPSGPVPRRRAGTGWPDPPRSGRTARRRHRRTPAAGASPTSVRLAQAGLTGDEQDLGGPRPPPPTWPRRRWWPARAARPTTPTAGRPVRRPGSGTDVPVPPPARGSHGTSTTSTGSGRPLRASSPRGRHRWRLRRPAMARTTSAARTCPPWHRAHKSGRLDHRVAEVVVVLTADLAPAEPDPEPQRVRLPAVVTLHTLLHGHAAVEGGRRRGEGHHEPVAQVLDLGAPGFGDGLAEDREVPAADLVGRLGDRPGQPGRSHDVREQDGHVLRGHLSPSAARTPSTVGDRGIPPPV